MRQLIGLFKPLLPKFHELFNSDRKKISDKVVFLGQRYQVTISKIEEKSSNDTSDSEEK